MILMIPWLVLDLRYVHMITSIVFGIFICLTFIQVARRRADRRCFAEIQVTAIC